MSCTTPLLLPMRLTHMLDCFQSLPELWAFLTFSTVGIRVILTGHSVSLATVKGTNGKTEASEKRGTDPFLPNSILPFLDNPSLCTLWGCTNLELKLSKMATSNTLSLPPSTKCSQARLRHVSVRLLATMSGWLWSRNAFFLAPTKSKNTPWSSKQP
jgi:hypothetical protein